MLYTDAQDFPLSSELRAKARANGIELRFMDGHDREAMVAFGSDCAGVFLMFGYVDDKLLARLPNWRILARIGTGYDRIDVDAARRRGLMVTYVPDFSTDELSNQVMMFVLAFARQLPYAMRAVSAHRWPPPTEFPVTDRLSEQSLGILGFGRSGQAVAKKARGFGLRVLTWSRTPRPALCRRLNVEEVSFEQALACDYVSVHLPLTLQTTKLINRDSLRRLKKNAVLINISRGGIVDTSALVDVLSRGAIRGAGLDVVDPDPLPQDHPLWGLPNVLMTLHTGALSQAAQRVAVETAFDDAGRYLSGHKPLHPVPDLVP
jgi:phosphoglycerate dehydrogenase-like enzyme